MTGRGESKEASELRMAVESGDVSTEAELQEYASKIRKVISESGICAEEKAALRRRVQERIRSVLEIVRAGAEDVHRERPVRRSIGKEQVKRDLIETERMITEERSKTASNLGKLLVSDTKIAKIKGKHEALEREIEETRTLLRRRQARESREALLFFVAMCMFCFVCAYVLLSRTRILRVLALIAKLASRIVCKALGTKTVVMEEGAREAL